MYKGVRRHDPAAGLSRRYQTDL